MKTVSISDEQPPTTRTVVEEEDNDEEMEAEDLDDEYDAEDCEGDESDFGHQVDFGQLLSNFFVTENGVNVADAIMELKGAMVIHNKLLHKLVKIKDQSK